MREDWVLEEGLPLKPLLWLVVEESGTKMVSSVLVKGTESLNVRVRMGRNVHWCFSV